MPNILKAPAKVHAAKAFLQSFYDVGGTDHIYIGLGAPVEWTVPASPDVPVDSFEEEENFWANMIGIGEISAATDTEMVTLRKNWETGTNYVAYDKTADQGTGSFDTGAGRDWYVANNDVNPKVYRCTIGFETTAVPSITEPVHNNPLGVIDPEGYKWEYLYTVGVDVGAGLATVTWLPVPDGTLVGSYSNGMAVTLGQLVMGDGTGNFDALKIYHCTNQRVLENVANGAGLVDDANPTTGDNTWEEWMGDHQIGAFWVACQLAFPDSAGTGGLIANVPYRQVALLRNPKDNSAVAPELDARITSQWKGSAFQTPLDEGVVMTIDNRVTITRAVGQTETVRLILEF